MEIVNEQPSQEAIEVKRLLEKFFVQVYEMPMVEQIKVLRNFQDFLVEQEKRAGNVYHLDG